MSEVLPAGLLRLPVVQAVVLGDFGRDAGLQLAAGLSRAERGTIRDLVGPELPFFDEYRRIAIALVGDLPFAKAEPLAGFAARGEALDSRILVGFPEGVPLAAVVPRLARLALEAMAGSLRRGRDRVVVLLPCNTLAPASWALEERFGSPEALLKLLGPTEPALREVAPLAASALTWFPTVPGSVLRRAVVRGAGAVMPLGTVGIEGVYRRAALRDGCGVSIVGLPPSDRPVVLEAIQASLAQEPARREAARRALQGVVERARDRYGRGLLVVEACTDLDYGLGLDSNVVYAEEVVRELYRYLRAG